MQLFHLVAFGGKILMSLLPLLFVLSVLSSSNSPEHLLSLNPFNLPPLHKRGVRSGAATLAWITQWGCIMPIFHTSVAWLIHHCRYSNYFSVPWELLVWLCKWVNKLDFQHWCIIYLQRLPRVIQHTDAHFHALALTGLKNQYKSKTLWIEFAMWYPRQQCVTTWCNQLTLLYN